MEEINKKTIEDYIKLNDKLMKEKMDLKREVDVLKNKLEIREKENEELKRDLFDATQLIEGGKIKVQAKANREYRKEIAALRVRINELENETKKKATGEEDYVNLSNAYNRLRADMESYKKNMDSARNETREVQKKYNELLMENEDLRKRLDNYMEIVSNYQKVCAKQDKNIENLLKVNDDLINVNKMLMEQNEGLDECECNCSDRCNCDEDYVTFPDYIEFVRHMMDVLL